MTSTKATGHNWCIRVHSGSLCFPHCFKVCTLYFSWLVWFFLFILDFKAILFFWFSRQFGMIFRIVLKRRQDFNNLKRFLVNTKFSYHLKKLLCNFKLFIPCLNLEFSVFIFHTSDFKQTRLVWVCKLYIISNVCFTNWTLNWFHLFVKSFNNDRIQVLL